MSVTFQRDATTVTLPDPIPGTSVQQRERQAVGRTAAGPLYVYDKGQGLLETELTFESLSDAEKGALAEFFRVKARGCMNTFTYTDPGGTAYSARFVDARLRWTKVCANVWDVRARMETG